MLTTSAVSLSSLNKNTRIIWFWRPILNFEDDVSEIWTRYSDFESEFIEETYQRMDTHVRFDGYIIDLKSGIQSNVDSRSEQRLVKREELHLGNYVRQERFSYSQRVTKLLENETEEKESFFRKWMVKNPQVKRNFSVIATLAAQGILEEGKRLNRSLDAQRMADELHAGITKIKNLDCAARLYTAESFLYKLVNSSLRNNDMTKIDTLGPFCYLLYHRLRLDRVRGDQILYRGMDLTDEMVNEYKQATGQEITWSAFTSTSKDRRVAEAYTTNTLCIISSKDSWRPQKDISQLSLYPDEQEVLLAPFHKFQIDRVEWDLTNQKHLIYMTTSHI